MRSTRGKRQRRGTRSGRVRIVRAEGPPVALEVLRAVLPRAVVRVLERPDDARAGRRRPRVMGVGVGDDDVDAVGPAVVAVLAEHDEAVAEAQLGMVHGAVVAAVGGLLLEAEAAHEPVDGGVRVAVAEGGEDDHGRDARAAGALGLGRMGGMSDYRLAAGPHRRPGTGRCAMEWVAYLA